MLLATSAAGQDSPVRLRPDGVGVQVHKVVDGAEWLIEQRFSNNAATGLVRQIDGGSDYLYCERRGYDDSNLVYECWTAPSDQVALGAGYLEGYEPIERPVVVPAEFFRVEGPAALQRFPPRLDHVVAPEPARAVLTLLQYDGVRTYPLDGGAETRTDGRVVIPLVELETGHAAVLEATQDPDGTGHTAWDYRLTVRGGETCHIHLFNFRRPPMAVRPPRRWVDGTTFIAFDLDPDEACPDPFASPTGNEVPRIQASVVAGYVASSETLQGDAAFESAGRSMPGSAPAR